MTAAYKCAPWCTDGDGHPDHVLRADQSCWGEEHVVVLGLEEGAPAIKPVAVPPPCEAPHISVFPHQRWHGLPTTRLHLYRETRNEHTSIDTEVHLTAEEALQLAANLIAVAETIRGRCAMSDDTTVLVLNDPANDLKFEVDCRPFQDGYPEYDGERILEIVHTNETQGSVVLERRHALRLAALLLGGD